MTLFDFAIKRIDPENKINITANEFAIAAIMMQLECDDHGNIIPCDKNNEISKKAIETTGITDITEPLSKIVKLYTLMLGSDGCE